jgi:hypothetical protein
MDLTTVKDVKELKSMAFDAIQAIEVQTANLRALQQRIAQLEQEAQKPAK